MITLKYVTRDDVELTIRARVTPYRRATYWEPAEGGEVEIVSVAGGELPEAEIAKVEEAVREQYED